MISLLSHNIRPSKGFENRKRKNMNCEKSAFHNLAHLGFTDSSKRGWIYNSSKVSTYNNKPETVRVSSPTYRIYRRPSLSPYEIWNAADLPPSSERNYLTFREYYHETTDKTCHFTFSTIGFKCIRQKEKRFRYPVPLLALSLLLLLYSLQSILFRIQNLLSHFVEVDVERTLLL